MKLSLLYTIIASLSQLILLELECIFLQTKTTKRRRQFSQKGVYFNFAVYTLWCTKRPLVGAPFSNDKSFYQTRAKRSIKTIVFTRRYLMLEKINHFLTETRKWTNHLSRFFWKSSWHLSSCILYTLTIILSRQPWVFACSEIFGLFFSNSPHSIYQNSNMTPRL